MSIFDHFTNLDLTSSQRSALEKLETFLSSDAKAFMLKGYAGSGKTTILKGLCEFLESEEKHYYLMAPTGRAAKVIRERTGKEAYTIHKSIYSFEELAEDRNKESFCYYFKIKNNIDASGKIFIVDEASMISDAKSEGEFFRFGTGHLLSDLLTFMRISSPNVNSKIIFIGDPCQLPPVGNNSSKAFDPIYLQSKFSVSVMETEMKEVLRQEGESGIIKGATRMRKSISSGFFNDFNLRPNGSDILNTEWESFLDVWQETTGSKIIIAGKNKTCLNLNLEIRERLFHNAHLLVRNGDIIIMGGNNYRKGVFNGEFGVVNKAAGESVSRIVYIKDKKPITLTWRDVELIFPENGGENKIVTGKLLENFLYGDNFLHPDETQSLYIDFTKRHPLLKPRTDEFNLAISQDPFFNCLLFKYGYAVTCHKAQGGEWENVFTVWDHDNTPGFNYFIDPQTRRGRDNETFFRWAYTAITRASKKIYALNPPFFNSYSSMTFIEAPALNSLNQLTGKTPETEEVKIDNEILAELHKFGLNNHSIQIQDHFIKVRHLARMQYIQISGWEKKNYEIIYHFERENRYAALKTWINGNNDFNGKFQVVPGARNNEELSRAVQKLLQGLGILCVKRNTVETVLPRLAFESDLEERFPFTRNLSEALDSILKDTGIRIIDIEHLQFKERYTFGRGGEYAVLDIEYKQNGFFGRIVPLNNKTNSISLLGEIRDKITTLKQEYAG